MRTQIYIHTYIHTHVHTHTYTNGLSSDGCKFKLESGKNLTVPVKDIDRGFVSVEWSLARRREKEESSL